MNMRRLGAAIAVVGATYLVLVAWSFSWWYVPALEEFASRHQAGQAPFGGTAFFIAWGVSGVLGPIVVALGLAIYSKIGALRLLLLAAGAGLLLLWLVMWSTSSYVGAVYGVGGGLILLFFLSYCLDWARTRRHLDGPARTASVLRLAATVSFFITAWGLCGLLGAPMFLLRPELSPMHGTAPVGSTLAVKVLACLVLGMGFMAVAERIERRNSPREKDENRAPPG